VHPARRRHSGYGVVTILYSGSMLYAIYDLHNVKYIGKRVLTNTPPCGPSAATARSTCASPLRACSTRWRLRWASIRSPVRRANFLKAPTFTDNDLMVNSYGLPECIDWVERESGWAARRASSPRRR
jgi:4-hydroxybenzoyl-CoA reductase subunit alpha